MKSKELITELSTRLGWSTQEVTNVLGAFGELVGQQLTDRDVIYLQGFGSFEVKSRMERISVNPANGKRYLVPPKLVPMFKPGMTVKSKLKEMDAYE